MAPDEMFVAVDVRSLVSYVVARLTKFVLPSMNVVSHSSSMPVKTRSRLAGRSMFACIMQSQKREELVLTQSFGIMQSKKREELVLSQPFDQPWQ